MLKKYLKINKTSLGVIILLVVGAIFVSYNQWGKRTSQSYKMPVLNLPLRYFSDNDIAGGNGISDDKNTWDSARVKSGYRSFPTTTIKLPPRDYSTEKEALPVIKSAEQLFVGQDEDFVYKERFTEQIQKYGVLANRFLPDETIEVEKFDVDGDGKEEAIVYACGLDGNHCPHRILIVKDDTVVFSVSGINIDLVKSETGNGFYVHWVPLDEGTKWDTGLCCSPGYISTRFVHEGGKFKPIYEQEILYFEVKNTEQ